MNVLDLFSGIGGFSLGFERAGFRTVAFCEVDQFCREWLTQQWPGVPIYPDVRTLDGRSIGPVDLVCGGFPCQDISAAGKGAGLAGHRSGLWFEMLRIVREVRPAWVVVENVIALRSRGADTVLDDLEAAGYSPWPFVVGADDIGAPQRRKRVWIIARRMGDADSVARQCGKSFEVGRSEGRDATYGSGDAGRVADADGGRREGERIQDDAGLWSSCGDIADGRGGARLDDQRHGEPPCRWPAPPGERQHEWEAARTVSHAECRLGVSADGLPRWMGPTLNRARLKAAGNTVVSVIPEIIGRVIKRVERECAA